MKRNNIRKLMIKKLLPMDVRETVIYFAYHLWKTISNSPLETLATLGPHPFLTISTALSFHGMCSAYSNYAKKISLDSVRVFSHDVSNLI